MRNNAGVIARVYSSEPLVEGHAVALADDEVHHVMRVLRLGADDAVRVFDGRGHEHEARIELAGTGGVVLRVGAAAVPAPEPPVALTLAQAVLKSDATDDVVRDAAMIGAAAIVPLVTARTETTLARLRQQRRVERWTRVAIASVKQCGRAVVPAIAEPAAFEPSRLALPAPVLMLVEPRAPWTGGAPVSMRDLLAGGRDAPALPPPDAATIVVGPEGGWADEELAAAAAAGWTAVTLGGRTLRADAAGLVAASLVLAMWSDE